jgi:ParB-like chromosome segregation protein Spo0J
MQKNRLEVVYRPTSELIPYARNARTHSEDQIAQIAASIREFGFNNPILLDGENGVIAGHGRLEAARLLNLKEVPCIELSHLSENEKKAYILADNRIALNSGWDSELLSLEIKDLNLSDVDLSLTGFDESELDNLLHDTAAEGADVELLDNVDTSYTVSIVCETLEEAQELNDRLKMNLDLSRQILKRKFSEITL